jgi:hypothetical protein
VEASHSTERRSFERELGKKHLSANDLWSIAPGLPEPVREPLQTWPWRERTSLGECGWAWLWSKVGEVMPIRVDHQLKAIGDP